MNYAIIRVLNTDIEALQYVYPHIVCPFCESVTFGLPESFAKIGKRLADGSVVYQCQPCYQMVGLDLNTGQVWQAEPDKRPEWPGIG